MPVNILNLPAYIVQKVVETDHDYHIYAEVAHSPLQCIHCKTQNLVGFGRREQLIRDLPMHGKRLGIYVDTRRYQCRSCNKTFYEPLPETDEKRMMTSRLVSWMGQQSIKRPFANVAEDVGVNEITVKNVFRDYVNELEKTFRFETPKWMGIDEIHIIRPRCVISNIKNNTVVDILRDRNKKTVLSYLSQLNGRENVRYVAMDMWNPYKEAVQAVLPQSTIVIDKFHVLRMANEGLEKARKSLRESLTKNQRRGLMHDRFVLLKRQRSLKMDEQIKLEVWTKNYPILGEAYRLKEEFFNIYEAKNRIDAQTQFDNWKGSIPDVLKEYFLPVVTAWGNWGSEILSYFNHPITNAYTESLNSLIRVMSRLGRGYSFEALRAKILFTEGIHNHTQTRPKYQRRKPAVGGNVPIDSLMFAQINEKEIREKEFRSIRPMPLEKNYGADISTLISMIEDGDI